VPSNPIGTGPPPSRKRGTKWRYGRITAAPSYGRFVQQVLRCSNRIGYPSTLYSVLAPG